MAGWTKWEYLTLNTSDESFPEIDTAEKCTEFLNKHGQDGWRFVQALPTGGTVYLIFKRPVDACHRPGSGCRRQ